MCDVQPPKVSFETRLVLAKAISTCGPRRHRVIPLGFGAIPPEPGGIMATLFVKTALAGLAATTVALGCATATTPETEPSDSTPDLAMDGLDEAQLITSWDANGMWTAAAMRPYSTRGRIEYGYAEFTGPGWATRRMGVCLLQQTSVACNSVADCAGVAVPTGGFRYCTSPGGAGAKKCWVRPGPQTTWCAGTPANGGVPIAPGTVIVQPSRSATVGSQWISYACFEGCAATDPSSSSVGVVISDCQRCGTYCCD
jgi:hypothetical protein